jgi:hypothetical protein
LIAVCSALARARHPAAFTTTEQASSIQGLVNPLLGKEVMTMNQTTLAQPKSDWYQSFRAGLKGRPQPRSTELDGLKTLVAQIAKELGALKQSLQKQADNAKPEFDPTRHLTKIQGKNYLEVKWRLVWIRSEHPDWSIETEPVEINTEKKYVIFRATVKDETGRVIATGTKAESKNGFADYLEKAETGAVGRALALCGYGTQFAPELNEAHRIVDAPVKRDDQN